jgi:hypothetical protein
VQISPLRAVAGQHARRVNERREFLDRFGSTVLDQLEQAESDIIYRRQGPAMGPGNLRIGAGASVLATQEQMDDLMRFRFAASLDTNVVRRTSNAMHLIRLLQRNEATLADLARNPDRYGIEHSRHLQAVIVSGRFARQSLGHAPRGHAVARAFDPSTQPSADESRRIQRHLADAQAATNVRLWMPVMVVHPDLHQLLRELGFSPIRSPS